MSRTPFLFVRRTGNAGLTLFELCVGLSIFGTLAGQALLALLKPHLERALHATAEVLGGDLRRARAEASRLRKRSISESVARARRLSM